MIEGVCAMSLAGYVDDPGNPITYAAEDDDESIDELAERRGRSED